MMNPNFEIFQEILRDDGINILKYGVWMFF